MEGDRLVREVNKLMRDSEFCSAALAVQKITTSEKGIPQRNPFLFALIGDRKSEKEYAVLSLGYESKVFGKDKITVLEAFPIFSEISVRSRPPLGFDLLFGAGQVVRQR
jgi:hypothetical protein